MQVLYQTRATSTSPATTRSDTSYEFDGMAGSLDHVLANTAAAKMVDRPRRLADQRRGVGGASSTAATTTTPTLLYQPNQFRASDHNPELVGLDAPFTQQASTVSVTATPDRIKKKKGTTRIDVTVTGAQGVTPTGTVRILVDGVQVGRDADRRPRQRVVGPFPRAGMQTCGALRR